MEALERYYSEYLMGCAQDSNCEGYNMDEQMTKDRIESILETGFMTEDDAEFVRSILPNIENERIRIDIAEYLGKKFCKSIDDFDIIVPLIIFIYLLYHKYG